MDIYVGTERPVPSVDAQQQPPGLETGRQRDGSLGEGRDAAERVSEGGVWHEEAGEGVLLLLDAAGRQRRDDGRYFANCIAMAPELARRCSKV